MQNLTNNYENFNKWLTGLIEGDGTFIIPTRIRDDKNRLLYPSIRIAFHRKDTPLAHKITEKLNYGHVFKSGLNTTIWSISSKLELLDLVDRLNGNMRTPKIIRLHAIMDNLQYNKEKLGIDTNPIESSSWLSGMSDADSNFSVNIYTRKNNRVRVQRQWRLEFAQKTYHGKDQTYWALWISAFLDTTLYTRSRIKKDSNGKGDYSKLFSSFIVVAHNTSSLSEIKNYFEKYPLRSSKYLDYKDWLTIEKLWLEYKNMTQVFPTKNKDEYLKNILSIKAQMNKNRNSFNWDHLNKF